MGEGKRGETGRGGTGDRERGGGRREEGDGRRGDGEGEVGEGGGSGGWEMVWDREAGEKDGEKREN